LAQAYLDDPVLSSHEADALIVVHDAWNRWTRDRLYPVVRNILERFQDKPSILVLNKVRFDSMSVAYTCS
jgi:50S ribosomal subunit-associated GTPase HflX